MALSVASNYVLIAEFDQTEAERVKFSSRVEVLEYKTETHETNINPEEQRAKAMFLDLQSAAE